MRHRFILLAVLCLNLLAACTAGRGEELPESAAPNGELIPYHSEMMGIRSLVPSDWVQFFPVGAFVRTMPQTDPTFLIFGAIPGATPDQMMASLAAQTGLQEAPESSGIRMTDAFNWSLYHFEFQQGLLLTYDPDYGTLVADVALAESDGVVYAVASGSPVNERDQLYETVFLPAVDALETDDGSENPDPLGYVQAKRDYWPTKEWRSSLPGDQGMDGDMLEAMVAFIKENHINIKHVMVIRHGYVVLDENFLSYQSRDKIASVTKSITSALIGIAIDQGFIEGVDQPVLSLFPDREITYPDARKSAMTVEDALTMRSGLDWPSGPCWWLDGQECNYYTDQLMLEDNDSLQFILDQPMAEEPGLNFNYIAGASHLLSAMISETTGMSAYEYARENLFGPLGIKLVYWPTDGEGLNLGYGDIGMAPQDMARFGYLFLNGGTWDGEQIISSEWVLASQKAHTFANNRGVQPMYGYQWWVNPDLGFYNAAGSGGNCIFVVPESDMVVVFTSNIEAKQLGQAPFWEGTPDELLRVYILPAVLE